MNPIIDIWNPYMRWWKTMFCRKNKKYLQKSGGAMAPLAPLALMALIGVHFPGVELDNAIWFSTLSRMSGFLWHSSKWACQFGCFLWYTPGLVASTPTLTVTTMLQLQLSLNQWVKLQQLLGCIIKDRYVAPEVLSPGPEALCWISSKMSKFPWWDS